MKSITSTPVHDVIGIGFGPSNIALAVALEEMSKERNYPLDTLFLERQQNYNWHGETLIDQCRIQISFLKDLVSLRNPTSAYSFINYLHKNERLIDFINRGTFNPCRLEFNDYLRWVAHHFIDSVNYGESVQRIEPEYNGNFIDSLKIIARDNQNCEKIYRTRNIVLATGGHPRIPDAFSEVKTDPLVFHHSQYLNRVQQLRDNSDKPIRVAVIGGGQSAAEAFMDLHGNFPNVEVDMILRGSTLKPADDSPFVNEIFAPAYTDFIFRQNDNGREKLLEEFQNTNYAAIDLELIDQIYEVFYRQKVLRKYRHRLLCRQQIDKAHRDSEGLQLQLRDIPTGLIQQHNYHAIILATGYERCPFNDLLEPLRPYLRDCQVDRTYRVQSSEQLNAGVYLQGFCETTHGLSDTLLSVLPMRSAEIGQSIYRSLTKTPERLVTMDAALLSNA